MRFPAVVVPAVLLLGGAVYFFAKSKESPVRWTDVSSAQWAPVAPVDVIADEDDRIRVHALLQTPHLSDLQIDTLIRAAGRRYMRRKLSYTQATQAHASSAALDNLRAEMDAARKVCNLAESFGRTQELAASAQADWELESRLANMPGMTGLAERYNGTASFSEADLNQMDDTFFNTFRRRLPVSTRGESAVHRAMGFDHTGRFDVALNPSQPEGVWARRYLTGKHVTFLAFRSAVAGKATGAHIHIGPPSTRRAPKS